MPRDIIICLIFQCSDIEISELPREKVIYKNITRQRSKELLRSEPMIHEIPDILKNNLRDEKFIRFDSGILDKNRYIFIASDLQLEHLKKSKIWLVDVYLNQYRLVFAACFHSWLYFR
ncbi:hypothetical protein DMUE_3371 [Dictyocoela muelleri]|nr:hypothetical protein DMUE_3371 [Dictyocoela muelleri]